MLASILTVILAGGTAAADVSCADVKSAYITQQCCESPDKDFAPECDALAFGDVSTSGLTVGGKLETPYTGCIDAPSCWRMDEFLATDFELRTNGISSSTPSSFGGMRSQQLYPYLTAYTYHHGNRTMLESDASKALRASNGGANPLYTADTRMITAMTFTQMIHSRNNMLDPWVKVTDPITKVLPLFDPARVHGKPIRKLVSAGPFTNSSTFKYADLNAYNWLDVYDNAEGKRCVRSTLPSGKTADIDCTLAPGATLETSEPKTGVLDVVTHTDVDATVDRATLVSPTVNATVTCGIGKDPFVTDGSDLLAFRSVEQYLDDASYGLTVVVPVGNEAVYHTAGVADGFQFFYKVVQFRIKPQQKAARFRDAQIGRTGHGPAFAMPGFQLDFPNRYVGMALYRYFYVHTFQSITLEVTGALGIMAPFAGETSGFTDAAYLRVFAETPLMYEPRTNYAEPLPGTQITQVALAVLEHSFTDATFPTSVSGTRDYAAFDYAGADSSAAISVSFGGVVKKYVMDPAGIANTEYMIRATDATDARLARVVPRMDPDVAHYVKSLGVVAQLNELRIPIGLSALEQMPTDRVHPQAAAYAPVYETFTALLTYAYTSDPVLNSLSLDAANPDARFVTPDIIDSVQLGFFATQFRNPTSPLSVLQMRESERTADLIVISAEAMDTLMHTLINIGKAPSGARVFPCSAVGMLFDPMDTTDEQIQDVSSYRDPPSEQADGKVSTTFGGVMAYEPDYETFRNTVPGASGTVIYDSHEGTIASVSYESQFYEVMMTATYHHGPNWKYEYLWPGATYMREKFATEYYLARLCLPN